MIELVVEVALVSVGAFFMRGMRGRVVNSGIGLLVDEDGIPVCEAEDIGIDAFAVVLVAGMRGKVGCVEEGGRGGPASDILVIPSIGES